MHLQVNFDEYAKSFCLPEPSNEMKYTDKQKYRFLVIFLRILYLMCKVPEMMTSLQRDQRDRKIQSHTFNDVFDQILESSIQIYLIGRLFGSNP